MRLKLFVFGLSVFAFLPLLLFSCATRPAETFPAVDPDEPYIEIDQGLPLADGEPPPAGLVFTQQGFPSINIPPGVGFVTTDGRDMAATLSETERENLSASFRNAYVNSRLRELPFSGVLGGDFVHGWPAFNPSAWVQNWRTTEPQSNSWGIPDLILAVRGFAEERETSGGRVFTVQGYFLDQYGRSGGIGGANGSVGYGSPRGYEFLYNDNLAQRFDLGLITVYRNGRSRFSPEEPPSLGLEPHPDIGVFIGGAPVSPYIQSAFITAWRMALDRGIESMVPDDRGLYFSLAGTGWHLLGVESVRSFFVQSFNQRSILLVLPVSPLLPPYPRFIASCFLETLLSDVRLPVSGAYGLDLLNIALNDADDFYRKLVRGMAMYGIPLTDPMPVFNRETGFWQTTQRFSRGWLVQTGYAGYYN